MGAKKRLLNLGSVIFLVLAAGLALGRWHERNSLLHPSHEYDYSPSEFGLVPEELFFLSGGERIHAWFFAGKREKPTLLYIQGNAGTAANRLGAIKGYVDIGLSVFIYEPRGFGQSAGMAARESFVEDSVAAYDWLVKTRGVSPDTLFILGQSLGGIPATRLAATVKCKGLILEGTLVSIRQMAKDFYPNVPIWLLASSDFDNLAEIAKIKVPVLFIYGGQDDIIPPYHSRMLFERAPEPKYLVPIEMGRHTDMFKVDAGKYYGAISKFTGL